MNSRNDNKVPYCAPATVARGVDPRRVLCLSVGNLVMANYVLLRAGLDVPEEDCGDVFNPGLPQL